MVAEAWYGAVKEALRMPQKQWYQNSQENMKPAYIILELQDSFASTEHRFGVQPTLAKHDVHAEGPIHLPVDSREYSTSFYAVHYSHVGSFRIHRHHERGHFHLPGGPGANPHSILPGFHLRTNSRFELLKYSKHRLFLQSELRSTFSKPFYLYSSSTSRHPEIGSESGGTWPVADPLRGFAVPGADTVPSILSVCSMSCQEEEVRRRVSLQTVQVQG
ncbi:hypothetical protein L227DRAFT_229742 [Lentinus tigrinus ALCF2SS1-6]|uniref:Uncharacterized protein n=1 Tax=Lentinus tigrinus ALCF2SS1-6 TaxID=1328759 RepID=A0A5C2S1S0_9APHY|nr:hypothetical protein L227DRAFT_229742 [Lentinus tigrinus ALCF2SS1-6]